MKRILLCCGMGMSSGFLAVNLRRAVRKHGLNYQIKACSASEVYQKLHNVDLLLVAPPFENRMNDFQSEAKKSHTKVELISKNIYGKLDGEALLKEIK